MFCVISTESKSLTVTQLQRPTYNSYFYYKTQPPISLAVYKGSQTTEVLQLENNLEFLFLNLSK